jgi:hypothetical protein
MEQMDFRLRLLKKRPVEWLFPTITRHIISVYDQIYFIVYVN